MIFRERWLTRESAGRLALGVALSYGAAVAVAQSGAIFPQGVSAGDVSQSSVVLWTRVSQPGDVLFEWSSAPDFSSVDGLATVSVEVDQVPAKWVVTGLQAGAAYWYRATHLVTDEVSRIGTFRTAAEAGQIVPLRFGVSGSMRGELSPFPAIKNADTAGLDFFVKLGNTIHADVPSPALPGKAAETLAEFRLKHQEVYSERFGLHAIGDLQAATAIFAMMDDHEVTDDFAGGASPESDPQFAGADVEFINQTDLYSDGVQAFEEYNAIEEMTWSGTGDARVDGRPRYYRQRRFGDTAAIFLLDGQSFRDAPLTNVVNPVDATAVVKFYASSFDPNRTMLGTPQLEQLKTDLLDAKDAGIVWKFVLLPTPTQNLGPVWAASRFEGYAAERTELLEFIHKNHIPNVVFIASDLRGALVNNLTYREVAGAPPIITKLWEITAGPVAHFKPFGPDLALFAKQAGLLTAEQFEFYQISPPIFQDETIKDLINFMLGIYGFDKLGLKNSPLDVKLVSGTYTVVHVYGWSEFAVDAVTHALRVRTWATPYYNELSLLGNPKGIVALEPLLQHEFTVNAVSCPAANVLSSAPMNGTVDARQPFPPEGSAAQGISLMTVAFDGPVSVDLACWSLCETAAGGNDIAAVTDLGSNTYLVTLDGPLTPNAATVIKYSGEAAAGFVSHPGNANADSAAGAADVLFLVDVLNGMSSGPYDVFSEDIDHSGAVNAADVLRLIDLLNGAGEYEVQNLTGVPDTDECD